MVKRAREDPDSAAGRKKKHPNAPKRCKSAYMFFTMERRQEIMESLGPNSNKVTDVAKKSSVMWKALPAGEKKKYEDLAKEDQARYKQEKSEYKGPLQVSSRRSSTGKDENAPKRPMSAFLFFSQDKRPEVKEKLPELKYTAVAQELGRMWRALTDAERKPYVDHELTQRNIYKENMAEWKKKRAEEEKVEKKQKVAEQKKTQKTQERSKAAEKLREKQAKALEISKAAAKQREAAAAAAAQPPAAPPRPAYPPAPSHGRSPAYGASAPPPSREEYMAHGYGAPGAAPPGREPTSALNPYAQDPYYGQAAYSQHQAQYSEAAAAGLYGSYGAMPGAGGLGGLQSQASAYDPYAAQAQAQAQASAAGLGGGYGSAYGYNPASQGGAPQYGGHLGYY